MASIFVDLVKVELKEVFGENKMQKKQIFSQVPSNLAVDQTAHLRTGALAKTQT
jgi:hypothetical protein